MASTKYIVLLGDGMPDRPVAALGGKTPLQAAKTPNLDRIATEGTLGKVDLIPQGYPAGSDVGHLSVLGYDPARYYTGRSPIEAAARGIQLGSGDVAYRMNLITLAKQGGATIMADFAGGHPETPDAAKIVAILAHQLGTAEFEFHAGVSYRHLLIWRGGSAKPRTVPAHDLSDKPVDDAYPTGEGSEPLVQIIRRSQELLAANQILPKVNSVWFWGQGTATRLIPFQKLHGIGGALISAVDLVSGIAVLAGLKRLEVPGITGYYDTNYEGKVEHALRYLRDAGDFVFLHVESTDEGGHSGVLANKIRALEDFDRRVVGPVLKGMREFPRWRVMVTSDHATPVELKTHVPDPAVFAILASGMPKDRKGKMARGFNEVDAELTRVLVKPGHDLMKLFLKG